MASDVVTGDRPEAPRRPDVSKPRRGGGPPDRLVAAAVLGGVRQRTWSVLILCAFLVLAAACAAVPMFAEASGNAAFQARRDAVPVTARQDDAAVVRLSADTGPTSLDQQSVLSELRSIPGLTEPRLTGGSVGAELMNGIYWESTAGAGDRRERARLFAVGAPASELVPVGAPVGGDGLWLPEPLADRLAVQPGDDIVVTVGARIDGERLRAPARVAGIYAVDADGRLPADLPGTRTWALRRGDTPGDTEFRTLPAYLLIGAVPTVERLAEAVDDRILWSAETALVPGATLSEARRTADRVETVRRRYASAQVVEGTDDPLSLRFASGIGRIVATAQATSEAVRQRTRPVEWAAITVGLASVLAVALLSARRRERELRHAVAVGMSPVTVGALWLLEHLLPALLGAALGWLVAWQLVLRFGPPGALAESLMPAALAAGAAALGGVVTVAGVGAATAARRVRPAPPAAPRRALPWGVLVVVAALVAAAGLAGGGTGGGTRGVDLLVPLLVLAAVGVLAGWLPGRLASRRRAAARPPTSPARAVWWLARRRLGAGGAERRLAVMVVTAGLGMLLFALSALQSTAVSADDRVAVAVGAEAVATLDGSWELDDAAVPVPPVGPDGEPPQGPVPGVRTPPLPAGNTLVWRTDVTTPLDGAQRDMLFVDPARLRDVALWGRGADLAAARAALPLLEPRPTDADGSIRAIAVADPGLAGLDSIQTTIGYETRSLSVVAYVPAFPGLRSRPMFVVAADQGFAGLGASDPRLRPRSRLDGYALFSQTYLWSASGAAGVNAVTAPRGVRPERVETAAELRQGDAYVATGRARGYQLAVAGYLALLAVLTLCVYAQRTAVSRHTADLMLARVGLGRARVAQARAVEFVLLAVVALGAAVAGVAALAPIGGRLLDDQPLLLPRFVFALSPTALAVTAGAAVLATVLAVVLTTVRSPSAEEDAYRDD